MITSIYSWHVDTIPNPNVMNLTDNERKALAMVAAGMIDDGIYRPADEAWESMNKARIAEALSSLGRFGYVTNKEWTPEDDDMCAMLTEAGQIAFERTKAWDKSQYRCCDNCVRLPCVCRERTYCPIHTEGNGCHGSHD